MQDITVTSQAEWDAAIAAHPNDQDVRIIIDSPAGVWLDINAGSAHVEARGSAHVVAWDSAHVVAWDSAHVEAWGSAHVVARGSAHVVAWDSAHVEAWGSAHVVAWGSAHVVAWGSAHVEARGSAHVEARGSAHVEAGRFVAVHLFSQSVTLSGGVVIDMTALDLRDPQTWCELTGVTIDGDGLAHTFKAVDADLRSGQGFAYPLGETLTDPKWRDNHHCGDGLHTSPSPSAARAHFDGATRFLEVTVPVADLRPIDSTKAKSRDVTVLREVDIYGQPITAAVTR